MVHPTPPPTYELIISALDKTPGISINDQRMIGREILEENKRCDPNQPVRLRQGEEVIGFVNLVQKREGPLRSVEDVVLRIQKLVETRKIFKKNPEQFIPTGNSTLIRKVEGIRVENLMLMIGNYAVATQAATFISEDVMEFKKLDAIRFSLGAPGGDPPFYFDLRNMTADNKLRVLWDEPAEPTLTERLFYSVKVFLQF